MSNQEEVKIGRPSLGLTKKVSVTLPEEVWQVIEQVHGRNKSAYIREVVAADFRNDLNKSNLIKKLLREQENKGDLN